MLTKTPMVSFLYLCWDEPHKLAGRKIYHGERGEVRNALRQGQEDTTSALLALPSTLRHPVGTQVWHARICSASQN